LFDAEHLHVAFDIGQVDALSVGRKLQAGEANLTVSVGVKILLGNGIGRNVCGLVRRQRQPLHHFTRRRVQHHQVVRFASGDKYPAIRAEGDGLRPHARQLDLKASGRYDLVGGRVVRVRANLADFLLRRES